MTERFVEKTILLSYNQKQSEVKQSTPTKSNRTQ